MVEHGTCTVLLLLIVLVPGKEYSKIRVLSLHGRSDNRRGFAIYIFNPCFRVMLAWDQYKTLAGRTDCEHESHTMRCRAQILHLILCRFFEHSRASVEKYRMKVKRIEAF